MAEKYQMYGTLTAINGEIDTTPPKPPTTYEGYTGTTYATQYLSKSQVKSVASMLTKVCIGLNIKQTYYILDQLNLQWYTIKSTLRNLPWPTGAAKQELNYNSTVNDVKAPAVNATLGVLQKIDELKILVAFEEELQWINANTFRMDLLAAMASNRSANITKEEDADDCSQTQKADYCEPGS